MVFLSPPTPGQSRLNDSAAIFAKDFSGLLLEKSAKTTRQPMPSAAPIRIWTSPGLQAKITFGFGTTAHVYSVTKLSISTLAIMGYSRVYS